MPLFFRHRERRLRRIAEPFGFDNTVTTKRSPAHVRRAFDHLLMAFSQRPGAPTLTRWRWLEAAHVLGQASLPLHWRSHTAMLQFAWTLGKPSEFFGQLMRLAMVPIGHLIGRLPVGNTGRAHVNAFRPMTPSPDIAALIEHALHATADRGSGEEAP